MATPPTTLPAELRVDLDAPLELAGGEAVDHLLLREPTIGEMAECDGLSGYAWMAKLIHLTTAIPMRAVNKLPVSAANKAGAYLTGFIEAGRKTRSAS